MVESMPDFLTVYQVADRIEVHPNTVRNMIRRGELQHSRHGRRIRISTDDLARYLRQSHSPPMQSRGGY